MRRTAHERHGLAPPPLTAETPPMAHGHHHRYDDDLGRGGLDAPAVRQAMSGVVAVLVVAALVGIAMWWPRGDPDVDMEATASMVSAS
jgi:succinate dehydrogenase hydrophobic anchor subunit